MAEEEYLKFHEESSNENNEEKSRDLQAEISKILGKETDLVVFQQDRITIVLLNKNILSTADTLDFYWEYLEIYNFQKNNSI